jgi:hypothetical protein
MGSAAVAGLVRVQVRRREARSGRGVMVRVVEC